MWVTVFHASPVPKVISDAETSRLIDVNDAFVRMFGQSREEILGSSALQLGYWEHPDRRRDLIRKVRAEGGFEGEEAWFRDARGRRGRMLLSCCRLELSGDGRLLWTIQDITERHRAAEWQHLLETAVDAAAHGIVITDRHGSIVWTNSAFTEMTGYGMADALGENLRMLRSGEQDQAFYEELWATILAGETWRGEITNRRKDGSLYTEHQSIVPLRHGGEEITHFVAVKEDISEEKARLRQLQETTDNLHGILDTAAGIIFRVRLPELVTDYVTPNVGAVTGFPAERWMREPGFWMKRIPDDDLERVLPELDAAAKSGVEQLEQEYRLRHADGSLRWYRSIVRFEYGAGDEPIALVGFTVDVTQRRELEDRLRHQATHDPLTGLANRALLAERLERSVGRARHHPEGIAVAMVDLQRFKRVNDSLGHTAGDRVLAEVARRLRETVPAGDTVARWGGDEFCLLLTDRDVRAVMERVRNRFLDRIREPISVMGTAVSLDATFGAVLFGSASFPDPTPVGHPEDLIRYADRALHRAKQKSGGPAFHLYDPREEGAEPTDALRFEQDLRRGLEAGEVVPFYQPIVRLETGEMWGVEALARWRHPERGLVGPGEFIALAEDSDLIHELGRQVTARACRDLSTWKGGDQLRLTVNVSGRQFESEDLMGNLQASLRAAGLAAERLFLEVTETSIMRATHRIPELRSLGLNVLIDDFGTGYSSFLYLRDLEADGLKIDMSFVQGLNADRGNRAIVEATFALARAMELMVIAEGIETAEHHEALAAMGCELGQGYRFGRPMPSDEMEALVATGSPTVARPQLAIADEDRDRRGLGSAR